MVDKVKQGKKNRASGKQFEVRTRADLESRGWIVDRWNNNVEWKDVACGGTITYKAEGDKLKTEFEGFTKDTIMTEDGKIRCGKIIPAKAKWNNFTKSMMMGSGGFPDFIAFRKHPGFNVKFNQYEVIGVECKTNGNLDKIEKEKCQWYLDNNIFSRILIAEKTKVKNKVVIIYTDFKEKYGYVTKNGQK